MRNSINQYYKKYKEVILYLIFGILTTGVNIAVFWICDTLIHIEYKAGNIIAWIFSVAFAFFMNKFFVFESKNKSNIEASKEAIKFILARIFSLVVDMLLMVLMIDVLKFYSLVAKIISNLVVVIINYVVSKFIIFKK